MPYDICDSDDLKLLPPFILVDKNVFLLELELRDKG